MECKNEKLLKVLTFSLKRRFEITYHEPSCYVGIEINRDRKMKTICINQQGYISRMLCRFGMENWKPTKSPMDCSIKLSESKNEERVIEKRFSYREAVGSLNYVALISRPDISYAANTLARFSNSMSELHWK